MNLERARSWMGRIREGSPKIVLAGTPRAFEVSPAEQIRYEVNERVGNEFAETLLQLADQPSSLTRVEFDRLADDLERRIPSSHKEMIKQARARLTQLMDERMTVEQAAGFLPAAYPHVFRTDDVSGIHAEWDLKISPFGAPILSIRDRGGWWDENVRGGRRADGLRPGNTPEEDEGFPPQLLRLLLIRDIGDREIKRKMERHELFHDLYAEVFRALEKPDYPYPAEREQFTKIKDELVAYLLIHVWQYRLAGLANLSGQYHDTYLFSSIWGPVVENICPLEDEDDDEKYNYAYKTARVFGKEVEAMCRELFRLNWMGSSAHDLALKKTLACQTFKELAYQFSTIETKPFAILPGLRRYGSPLHLGACNDVLESVHFYNIEATDREELRQLLIQELTQPAIWQRVWHSKRKPQLQAVLDRHFKS